MLITRGFPPGILDGPIDPAFEAQSRVPAILIGSILPFSIATIFVLARFYSRAIIMKNWGVDDSWILLSWCISIVFTALNVTLTTIGAGRHLIVQIQHPENIGKSLLYGFLARLLYLGALWTTKLGICAFYLRIFQDRWSKIFVWTMMGVISAFSLPLIIGAIFQCKPIEGAWSAIDAKCMDGKPPTYAGGILNILSDAALLAFVIPKILHLQINTRQKISLLSIIGLSVLVIAAAIIRLARVVEVIFSETVDISWDSYDITIWSSVEVNTGLFCASAAAIKPLIRKVFPSLLPSTDGSRSHGNTRSKAAGTYGTSTITSRHMGNGAIELHSQTDPEEFSPSGTLSSTTNQFWSERKKTSSSDDSETEVLGLQNARGIQKTVSVHVTAQSAEDLGLTRGNGVRRFEHV